MILRRAVVARSSAALFLATIATPAGAADLMLKRVMLSSAGVGYFEYSAEVDGPVTLGLNVPLDEVDDVLKSLVVFDDAGGVGGIELPGRDQTHSAFGDVPFGPDGLQSPLAYINSLQGVEIAVQGPRPMNGRIMQAETVHEATGGHNPDGTAATQDRTRVTLLTADGLKQFVLEDSDTVQVADAALRARINRALASLRHESGQDARHITIRAAGAGHRTVRVGYVAVAPLWKASYRLVLPSQVADPAQSRARMQGWATLENASGADWDGVDLSLQYGNPVTFHQAIYRSYFVQRPEVPVEVLGRLLPDVDTRARESDVAQSPPPPSPPASMAFAAPRAARPAGAAFAEAASKMATPTDAVVATEGAEETIFTLPNPVTLAAGHSASVPILDQELPAERISLARQGQTNPLASLKVTNATKTSFPAGVLTLYAVAGDAPYAGDARLGGLPAGESRLLSFAQDLRTTAEWKTGNSVTIGSLTAARGQLELSERIRQTTRVTITAPAQEPRRVLLELPKVAGGIVSPDGMQPSEVTATAWRFAVSLKPAEVREVTIDVDRNQRSSTSLIDDQATLLRVLNMQGLGDTARAALSHVRDLRAQEATHTAERDQLQSQRDAADKDEERIRANLAAVSSGDALRTRLVKQLDNDETRIAQLDSQIEQANRAIDQSHQVLLTAIANLKL